MRCAVSSGSDELDDGGRQRMGQRLAEDQDQTGGHREALADRGLALRNWETGTAYAASASIEMA